MKYNLAFIGFGNVARALARLLERKRDVMKSKYGITYSVTGIATGSHGFAVNPNGLDVNKALELVESKQSISTLSTFQVNNSLEVIRHSSANVMFENSPVNTQTGQPALDHIRTALELGTHAITANKGPVVHGYRELTALAEAKGKKFRFESAVLGGAPVFSVMREAFPLAEIASFKGILNATTDGHTTMLLGAARYLAEPRNFDGTAYLIFQPGEEGYAGAKAMIEDGLFERFPAEQVFALHNWPGLPPGHIGLTPGPAMGAADRIEIVIDGRGGPGAHPHAAIDPVLVAGHIITAAQSIVSRNVSPIDTAVVSLCAMHAGNPGAMSVIPSHATLVGTVRTFRPDART